MIGWLILAVVAVPACLVLYASDQPGHRRRKNNPDFEGPNRRDDLVQCDFFQHPIFRSIRRENQNAKNAQIQSNTQKRQQ